MKTKVKPKKVYVVIEFSKRTATMPSMPKKILGAFPTYASAEKIASQNPKIWCSVVEVPYYKEV